MLSLIPFTRSGREMADDDFEVLALCPLMEGVFPKATVRAVAVAAAVCHDEDFAGFGVSAFEIPRPWC
jgi:hypothetical protein